MAITKTDKGYMVDIQPEGRGGKRYRKTLKTKMEALRWEALIRNTTAYSYDHEHPFLSS